MSLPNLKLETSEKIKLRRTYSAALRWMSANKQRAIISFFRSKTSSSHTGSAIIQASAAFSPKLSQIVSKLSEIQPMAKSLRLRRPVRRSCSRSPCVSTQVDTHPDFLLTVSKYVRWCGVRERQSTWTYCLRTRCRTGYLMHHRPAGSVDFQDLRKCQRIELVIS